MTKPARKRNRHGGKGAAVYNIWQAVKKRCYDPNDASYRLYGARGITVCQRWLENFVHFRDDMGPRPTPLHSIERIDGNGSYEPLNCKWATPLEQSHNRRNNVNITIDGVTRCQQEWSRIAGVSHHSLHMRLKKGLTGSALIAPSSQPHRKVAP